MNCNQCDNDGFEESEDGIYYCLQCGAQSEICATPNQFVVSVRKSSRIGVSICAVSDAVEAEEEIKKMKKAKKTHQNWSDEDEVFVLKNLVDFRVQSGNGSEIDWDAFYDLIGSSIAGKFSKKQVFRKIKELKSKYLDHSRKLKLNDPQYSKCTESQAFGYSVMLWGLYDGESDPERLNKFEEPVNDSGPAKLTENESDLKTQQSNKDKEQHNEAGNIMKNDTTGKVNQDDYDDLGFLCDAFYTLISISLSDHQKELQLDKLMYLGAETKRQLGHEWRTICAEETELKIRKFRFSAMLAKAAEAVTEKLDVTN